jgi:membrane associated rhomboid family serine protease
MNGLMLLAFGAGAERMLGLRRAALLFLLSGLAGALAQVAFGWGSPIPMIGASGALSGLFAALCLRLQQTGNMQMGRYGIWGVGALWIGLSLFMAFVGGSIGIGDVAWAAHAGGFIAGVMLMRLRYFS